MQYLKALSLATLIAPALGDIVVDFWASYDDCSADDDPGKSTTLAKEANGNCIAVNNDYDTLKITTDDGTALDQCGPYFTDSSCETEIEGSEPITCGSCSGYTENVYIYAQ